MIFEILAINYTLEDRQMSEKMINYWTNFAKYDNPNYLKPTYDSEYWQLFLDNSIDLESLTAEQKLNTGRYLKIEKSQIKTIQGFSQHQCKIWNYTKDGESIPIQTTTESSISGVNENVSNIYILLTVSLLANLNLLIR